MVYKISNVKIIAIISVVVSLAFVSLIFLQNSEAENLSHDRILKAAIIDQLYDEVPNDFYHKLVQDNFVRAGYEVDIYKTQDVTVDLFKKLPTMNYDFVVIRTHGAADQYNENDITLFTGERYSEENYISEQLFGGVSRGIPVIEQEFVVDASESSQWQIINDTYRVFRSSAIVNEITDKDYFVITPKFVKESMRGKFTDTVFFIGGCNSLSNPSLAQALVEKGASAVVGWDDIVGSGDNDRISLNFLNRVLLSDEGIEESVNSIMNGEHRINSMYDSSLKFYS